MMKVLNENQFIKNNENTVDVILVMLNQQQMMQQQWKFIRTCKKFFLGCKFCFY